MRGSIDSELAEEPSSSPANQVAALAFMIVGAGTSIGAIGGALGIARWRVIVLMAGILWVRTILCGYAFNLVLTLGFF